MEADAGGLEADAGGTTAGSGARQPALGPALELLAGVGGGSGPAGSRLFRPGSPAMARDRLVAAARLPSATRVAPFL